MATLPQPCSPSGYSDHSLASLSPFLRVKTEDALALFELCNLLVQTKYFVYYQMDPYSHDEYVFMYLAHPLFNCVGRSVLKAICKLHDPKIASYKVFSTEIYAAH